MTNNNGKANNTNKKVQLLNAEELAKAIMSECKKASKSYARKFYSSDLDAESIESFLITEIYTEMMKKDNSYHSVRFIRRLIKLRIVDLVRESARFDDESIFSMFENENEEGDVESFESTVVNVSYSTEKQAILNNEVSDFRSQLTERQNTILDMVIAGYDIKEIADTLGVHRNTPRNELNKIQQLALDMGLDMLLH